MVSIINLILVLVCYSQSNALAFNGDQNLYPNYIPSVMPNQDFSTVTEELFIDELIEDEYVSQLFSSKGIRQWQSLKIGQEIYLLGIRDEGITLTIVHRKKDSLFQLNEMVIDLNEKISCATAFKVRSDRHDTYQVQLLIAMESPSHSIHWYRIDNYKLELVTNWNHNALIKGIVHFENRGDEVRTISFLEQFGDGSFLKVYAYSLEQNVPHIWFQESLPLEDNADSLSVMVAGEYTFLATVQADTGAVTFYRNKNICTADCKFRRIATVEKVNASEVIAFRAYNGHYFAISGSPSIIVAVGINGVLRSNTEFKGITELMVLEVHNSREDVIIFGRNADNLDLFTHSSLDNQWTRREMPPCIVNAANNEHHAGYSTNSGSKDSAQHCLRNTKWEGATSITAAENPTVVLAGEKVRFIHVMCSLRMSPSNIPFNYGWFSGLHHQFQGSWNRLDNRLSYLLNPTRSREIEDKQGTLCEIDQEIHKLILLLQTGKLSLDTVHCARVESNSTKIGDTGIKHEAAVTVDSVSEEEDKGKTRIDGTQTVNNVVAQNTNLVSKYKPPPIYRTKISTDLEGDFTQYHDELDPPLHSMISRMMNGV